MQQQKQEQALPEKEAGDLSRVSATKADVEAAGPSSRVDGSDDAGESRTDKRSEGKGHRRTIDLIAAIVVLVVVVAAVVAGLVVGLRQESDRSTPTGMVALSTTIDFAPSRPSALRMSSDAKYLVIGSDKKDEVRVYQYNASTRDWVMRGQALLGTTSDGSYDPPAGFGSAVALGGDDGNLVACGIPGLDNSAGHVRTYEYALSGLGNWRWLTPAHGNLSGPARFSHFGSALAISGDGGVLVVGAPHYLSNDTDVPIGYVQAYRLDKNFETRWLPHGQALLGNIDKEYVGTTVELSDDGSVLAVLSFQRGGSGLVQAYKFETSGGLWVKRGTRALNSSGGALALSGDGRVVATTGMNRSVPTMPVQFVRLFRYVDESSDWTQLGKDILGVSNDLSFGLALSLSHNGSRMALGAQGRVHQEDPLSPVQGRVQVYDYGEQEDAWKLLEPSLLDLQFYDDKIGVSLSGDGAFLTVGTSANGTRSYAVNTTAGQS